MRIDGLWAADEDTVEVDPVRRDSDAPEPLKTGHEWDEPEPARKSQNEPEEPSRTTYDDIPCTD